MLWTTWLSPLLWLLPFIDAVRYQWKDKLIAKEGCLPIKKWSDIVANHCPTVLDMSFFESCDTTSWFKVTEYRCGRNEFDCDPEEFPNYASSKIMAHFPKTAFVNSIKKSNSTEKLDLAAALETFLEDCMNREIVHKECAEYGKTDNHTSLVNTYYVYAVNVIRDNWKRMELLNELILAIIEGKTTCPIDEALQKLNFETLSNQYFKTEKARKDFLRYPELQGLLYNLLKTLHQKTTSGILASKLDAGLITASDANSQLVRLYKDLIKNKNLTLTIDSFDEYGWTVPSLSQPMLSVIGAPSLPISPFSMLAMATKMSGASQKLKDIPGGDIAQEVMDTLGYTPEITSGKEDSLTLILDKITAVIKKVAGAGKSKADTVKSEPREPTFNPLGLFGGFGRLGGSSLSSLEERISKQLQKEKYLGSKVGTFIGLESKPTSPASFVELAKKESTVPNDDNSKNQTFLQKKPISSASSVISEDQPTIKNPESSENQTMKIRLNPITSTEEAAKKPITIQEDKNETATQARSRYDDLAMLQHFYGIKNRLIEGFEIEGSGEEGSN
ncbi:hypothetical protein L596_020578 [Steinernema carpocapsae]|uniref:Uncharacterized protein n=1 Tax=Steinernema carpocapsae TaxID=34508 RepID=A0A4U5MUQ3_STECR|nr:hypothetical protein L596_020578 [Steinernema carpocapsae]